MLRLLAHSFFLSFLPSFFLSFLFFMPPLFGQRREEHLASRVLLFRGCPLFSPILFFFFFFFFFSFFSSSSLFFFLLFLGSHRALACPWEDVQETGPGYGQPGRCSAWPRGCCTAPGTAGSPDTARTSPAAAPRRSPCTGSGYVVDMSFFLMSRRRSKEVVELIINPDRETLAHG